MQIDIAIFARYKCDTPVCVYAYHVNGHRTPFDGACDPIRSVDVMHQGSSIQYHRSPIL